MAIERERLRFTRADYHRMAEHGIIKPDARVELIDGEIIRMSPIGRRHNAAVDRAARILDRNVGDDAIVRTQGSIALGDDGEPEPDLVLLRYQADFYADEQATAADVLLVVEVADSSEEYDREVKVPLYARHGIPETWVANLNRDQVVAYRDPTPSGYATMRIYRRGESLSPLAFPELVVPVAAILG